MKDTEIQVRVSQQEKKLVNTKAKKLGFTVSEFLRLAIHKFKG